MLPFKTRRKAKDARFWICLYPWWCFLSCSEDSSAKLNLLFRLLNERVSCVSHNEPACCSASVVVVGHGDPFNAGTANVAWSFIVPCWHAGSKWVEINIQWPNGCEWQQWTHILYPPLSLSILLLLSIEPFPSLQSLFFYLSSLLLLSKSCSQRVGNIHTIFGWRIGWIVETRLLLHHAFRMVEWRSPLRSSYRVVIGRDCKGVAVGIVYIIGGIAHDWKGRKGQAIKRQREKCRTIQFSWDKEWEVQFLSRVSMATMHECFSHNDRYRIY